MTPAVMRVDLKMERPQGFLDQFSSTSTNMTCINLMGKPLHRKLPIQNEKNNYFSNNGSKRFHYIPTLIVTKHNLRFYYIFLRSFKRKSRDILSKLIENIYIKGSKVEQGSLEHLRENWETGIQFPVWAKSLTPGFALINHFQ